MDLTDKIYLVGCACTFNEADMIPYVMPYIERMGYDKFIVYDNESTDNTVELLKQYDFVEVRTYSTNGVFDDVLRTNKIMEVLKEYYNLSLKKDKIYCFVNVDFDEVHFLTARHTVPFKAWLYNCYKFKEENIFCDTMIDIVPPESKINYNKDVYKLVKYPHLAKNMHCCYWNTYGDKTTIIILNDFDKITITPGNHRIFLKPRNGVKIKNMKYSNELFGFHLKYIDKNILLKKNRCISKRYHNHNKSYEENNVDYLYDCINTISFPLKEYFSRIQMERRLEDPLAFENSKMCGVFNYDYFEKNKSNNQNELNKNNKQTD